MIEKQTSFVYIKGCEMPVIQSYNRGVRDLKLATWNGANSFGAAYDVLGIRQANLSWTVESDELRGDDTVLDRYTKVVAANLTIQQASIDMIVLKMILGGTLTSAVDYYDIKIGESDEVPYVAIAGRIVGSGGAGDLQFLLPKAKISGNLNFNAQVDTYLIPQVDFQGVNEGAENGMLRMRHFVSATNLSIPLRVAVGGL